MRDYIKTGFPILDDVLAGGVREGLVILRCEGVPCAWVAERIVENLHRNAESDYDVTTVGDDAQQAGLSARMNGRIAALIRCGYEVRHEAHSADLILEIKAVDGGYEVRVAKHRHGRIGGGVVLASDNGVLADVWAIPAPIAMPAVSLGGTEAERWETAMRDVADYLGRLSSVRSGNRDAADILRGKSAAYAHAAEMLRAAIKDMKETP